MIVLTSSYLTGPERMNLAGLLTAYYVVQFTLKEPLVGGQRIHSVHITQFILKAPLVRVQKIR